MAIAGAGTAEVKPELVDYLGYTDCIDLKDDVWVAEPATLRAAPGTLHHHGHDGALVCLPSGEVLGKNSLARSEIEYRIIEYKIQDRSKKFSPAAG